MDGEQNNLGPSEKNGSAGPVIAVIIILALALLGGLYFWKERGGSNMASDEAVESIEKQSDSDDAASIEADLDATDVDNLDSEINAS